MNHENSPENFYDLVQTANQQLLKVRDKRLAPGKDDKIITSWNCLAINTFAEVGAVLRSEEFLGAAIKCAEFLQNNMLDKGRLLRIYRNGKPKLNAYLEDYSFFINSLLTLHSATLESKWLTSAISLADSMINLFWDPN